MLLWNGSQILKAKLKDRQLAREQYEDVVDRQKIVPPRDPALITYEGGGVYGIQIYPARLNESRKNPNKVFRSYIYM